MTSMPIGETARMLVEGNPAVDGSKRGKTGVEIKRPGSYEIAEWLQRHSPVDVDKAAVSRAQSHGVNLEIRYEGRYPVGPNGEYLPSYQVAVGCSIHGSQEARNATIADLEKFQTPASVHQIEEWLAELSVLTAGRGTDGIEAELQLTAYSSRLAEFPADVARYALLKHSWKWFPSWGELEKVCVTRAAPRRHMIAALSMPEPDPEPVRRAATQEEKDRMAALIAERFPNVPSAWREKAVGIVTSGKCIKDDAE